MEPSLSQSMTPRQSNQTLVSGANMIGAAIATKLLIGGVLLDNKNESHRQGQKALDDIAEKIPGLLDPKPLTVEQGRAFLLEVARFVVAKLEHA